MRKGLAYLCLGLITLAILGVDGLILTSSATLSRIAKREIDGAFGTSLEYGSLEASIGGTVTIRNVAFHLTEKRIRVFSADRATVQIARRDGRFVPESVTLVEPRFSLSHDFLEQITKEPAGRPLREAYPPDSLPRIRCQGGQVEIIHKAILHWSAPQTFTIEDLSLVPVSGYRYFAGGRIKSTVLGAWLLNGEFDLDTGAVHLSLTSDSVMLGPRVREILAPSIHADWDRYRADGPAAVRVQLDSEPGQPVKFRATVSPAGVKLLYEGFPYPVEDVRGEIDFFADGFVIKHMTARRGNTRIRFDGRAGGYAAEADYKFRIEIDSMPIDDVLRAALKPDARKIYDQFRPSGTIHAKGFVMREYGVDKQVQNPLDIRFSGSAFRYLPIPYEITDVDGEIHIDIPSVRVKYLSGRHDAAPFQFSGTIEDIETDPSIDLRIRAQNVSLDRSLKLALAEPERKLWDRFAPSGTVDLDWTVRKKKGEKELHFAQAVARKCMVTYKECPLPVREISGYISFDPDMVRLSHMEGELDKDSTVSITATVATRGPPNHHYEISAVGARIDKRFKDAMPKPIADLLDTLHLTGLCNFRLDLRIFGEGEKEEMHWTLRANLRRAAIETAILFEDIDGTVDFIGSIKNGKTSGLGSLTFESARVVKKKVTDLAASFRVEGDEVSFSNIRGTAYNGLVTGELKINSKTTDLAGWFKVDRLELRKFVSDTENYQNRALSGTVALEIRKLAGRGSDTTTLTGEGSMTIADGQLFEVPFIANILVPFASTRRFDAGKVLFEIRNRRFDILSFGFESESGGSVVGKGRLTFDGDYKLRIKVRPAPFLGIRFFLFEIPSAIVGEFLRTELEGNIEEKEAKKSEVPEEKDK